MQFNEKFSNTQVNEDSAHVGLAPLYREAQRRGIIKTSPNKIEARRQGMVSKTKPGKKTLTPEHKARLAARRRARRAARGYEAPAKHESLVEKFSNTVNESAKGEAIKQGAKKAVKYARVMGKKAYRGAKKYLKQPSTKGAAIGAGVVGWTSRGLVDRKAYGNHIKKNYIPKAKHESLIEKLDRVTANIKYTNEINLAAAGNAIKSAGKSVFNGAKNVVTNVGNTAKTVGGAIKKHPYRTAAGVAAVGGGYLGYKGAKKAAKVGKSAYQDWKI